MSLLLGTLAALLAITSAGHSAPRWPIMADAQPQQATSGDIEARRQPMAPDQEAPVWQDSSSDGLTDSVGARDPQVGADQRREIALALLHIARTGGTEGFAASRSRNLALMAMASNRHFVRWNRR